MLFTNYRHAAGCIVRDADTKMILLLRRSINETSFHGMWELPGGKLEEDELPEETALNETTEETGLGIYQKLVKTDIKLDYHIDHDMKKIYYGFLVETKNPTVELSDEHDGFMWITVEGALSIEPLSHHAHFLLSQL
jgi:8-oxo-dGTP pyrophosphatase MutT (NUDIX family)